MKIKKAFMLLMTVAILVSSSNPVYAVGDVRLPAEQPEGDTMDESEGEQQLLSPSDGQGDEAEDDQEDAAQEEQKTDTGSASSQDNEVIGRQIIGFAELSEEQRKLMLDEKIPLEELKLMLPAKLQVYIEMAEKAEDTEAGGQDILPEGQVPELGAEEKPQEPEGENTQKPGGEGTQQPGGENTQQPDGEGDQQPGGENTQQPDGEGDQQPGGENTQQPDGEDGLPPEGGSVQEPGGEIAGDGEKSQDNVSGQSSRGEFSGEKRATETVVLEPLKSEAITNITVDKVVQADEEGTVEPKIGRPEEIEVTWECEEYESSSIGVYEFHPVWDREQFPLSQTLEENMLPRIEVIVRSEGIELLIGQAREALAELLKQKTVYALVYLSDSYSLRQEAASEGQAVISVPSGQLVQIVDVDCDEQADIWYKVKTYQNDQEYEGYVNRYYLAYSDEDFIQWEDEYLAKLLPPVTFMSNNFADVEQFPSGYQQALYQLKSIHPNWAFVKMDTGLDWNTVVVNEMQDGRSLVPSSSPESWKTGNYGGGWSYASEGILKHYLDPRNFLSDPYIFQFEQLTFNSSYHTQAAVQGILNSTFMAGPIPGDGRLYSAVFWDIGNSLRVSPFHLASRVYQEQGSGTSSLISGTYPGYENLYNYFNIGATGKTTAEVIVNGLKKARNEGWNNRYASLYGGARIIAANYILKGQDTIYLQKFDVDGSNNGMFWHQYMQNIMAPYSESQKVRNAYGSTGSINSPFVFRIPVYRNMPASPCPKPGDQNVPDQNTGTVYNGVDYSPVFDASYYYSQYPDIAKSIGNDPAKLLKHFVTGGMLEGRRGSEEFDVFTYRSRYADLAGTFGNDLPRYYLHYIGSGKAEGRSGRPSQPQPDGNTGTVYNGVDYSAVFDASYYYQKYIDLARSIGNDPKRLLAHFATSGVKEGRRGNEEFEVHTYKNRYADLSKAFGNDLPQYYLHYIGSGKKEGRSGRPSQSQGQPDTNTGTVYQGVDYAPVFDASYYYSQYPDIARTIGDNPGKLLEHFVTKGMKEGRRGSEEFDVYTYKKRYVDLSRAFGDDLSKYYLHYIGSGKKEGRSGRPSQQSEQPGENTGTIYNGKDYSSVFNFSYYFNGYPDVARTIGNNPAKLLEHFVTSGMKEGRRGNEEFDVYTYKNRYADLTRAFGNDLPKYYLHYVDSGKKEGRSGKPSSPQQSADAIYKGVNYASVFSASFYYAAYPDVANTYGDNPQKLLEHFVNSGMKEGRRGSEEFDVYLYKTRYADLAGTFGNDLIKYYQHYIETGKQEGRKGN